MLLRVRLNQLIRASRESPLLDSYYRLNCSRWSSLFAPVCNVVGRHLPASLRLGDAYPLSTTLTIESYLSSYAVGCLE